jgi:hypothetical protein
MKIVSLKKLVEDNDINIIEVEVGEGVKPVSFEVGSPDYREQELFLVKGEYQIGKGSRGENLLRVARLEKELNIELNPVTVIADEVAPEEEEKLNEFVNTPITAIVFHRKTLASAGRETKRKFVTAYAESVIESYRKNFSDDVERDDFAVIEIDFDNKAVAIKSIAPEEVKTEEVEEGQE